MGQQVVELTDQKHPCWLVAIMGYDEYATWFIIAAGLIARVNQSPKRCIGDSQGFYGYVYIYIYICMQGNP